LKIKLSKLRILEVDGKRVNPAARTRNTKDLQASMAKVGQLTPILVEAADEDGKHRILSGHRRVTAARALKWKEIEAEVVTEMNMGPLFVMAVANIEKPLTPLETARHAGLLRVHEQCPDHNIAAAFGVSKSRVADLFSLLNASPKVQKLVDEGKMSWSAFRKLMHQSPKRQDEIVGKAQERAKGDHVTVAAVKKAKKAVRDEENGEPMVGDPETFAQRMQRVRNVLVETATANLSNDEKAVIAFCLPSIRDAVLELQALVT
jgi:ParB family chromosome partitioning protein